MRHPRAPYLQSGFLLAAALLLGMAHSRLAGAVPLMDYRPLRGAAVYRGIGLIAAPR